VKETETAVIMGPLAGRATGFSIRRRAPRTIGALLLFACLGASPLVEGGCGGGAQIRIEGETPVIGSQFAVSILIPARYGGGTAFVQTASPPLLGVVVFDLDSFPGSLSSRFVDMGPYVRGIPDSLVMEEDRDLAFLATSGEVEGVTVFDPARGFELLASYSYTDSRWDLPKEAEDSDGHATRSVRPVFTAGVAFAEKKLYMPTSNYTRVGSDPVCAPGTVHIVGFDPDAGDPRFLTEVPHPIVLTTGFNPTEATPFTFNSTAGGDFSKTYTVVLITNTGVLAIRGNDGIPLTSASVDVIDPVSDCIVATYPLGGAAPSFTKIAIARQYAPDGQPVYRGYLGSAAYNHVYEIDLTGLEDYLPQSAGVCPEIAADRVLAHKVLASVEDPLVSTSEAPMTAGFTYQVVVDRMNRAFATGFTSGTVAVFELETGTVFDEASGRYVPVPSPKRPKKVIQVTDPMPSLNETSPGPVAVRPGLPCEVYKEDGCFYGPDVFVVTGTPTGELRSLRTYDTPE